MPHDLGQAHDVRDRHACATSPTREVVPSGTAAFRARPSSAFDRTDGQVWEALVDLPRRSGRRLAARARRAAAHPDRRRLPGRRVACADPRRAALAKRGITDIDNVQVDPWSAGYYGLPDEEGRRLSHTFCWYRNEMHDNGYAHPIEGLCAVIDLDRAEVLRIDDYGPKCRWPAATTRRAIARSSATT